MKSADLLGKSDAELERIWRRELNLLARFFNNMKHYS